jgi:streptogramin lyase
LSRVSWTVRSALVPAGAALVALAALSGSANASPARPVSVSVSAAKASTTTKGSVSFYQTYGMQQGAVRGPGGPGGAGPQVWLIAMDPPAFQGNPTGSQALDEVSPTTGKVNYWAPLPPYVGNNGTLLAYVDGPPAFDGSGNAWMIATSTTFSGTQSHYLVRYTPGPSTFRIFKLAASCSSPHGITAASDGSVWLACNSAKVMRVTASGAMRTSGLSRVATIASLAPANGGVMWAVGENSSHAPIGLVRLSSAGRESYYATPRGITARGVAGDNSSRVIETASCGSSICFESVSPVGKLSRVATTPGKVSGSTGPAMDTGGNVWLLMRGTASSTGQYFLKLTSANKVQVYTFSLPDCGGALLTIAGNPVGSANGSAWAESVTNCTSIGNTETAYVGGVVRLKP